MSPCNATICKLCQQVLAHGAASMHQCDVWCGNSDGNQADQELSVDSDVKK